MSQKLSVVIPTLNVEQVLPSTLQSLMEGIFSGVIGDLVIVDGGSNDATINIAKEVGATVLEAKPSRGGQIFASCGKLRRTRAEPPNANLTGA